MSTENENTNTKKFAILIVDDDRFLLDMYAMKFSRAGYAVHAAPSAQEALDAIRGGFAPDAIVFDLVMPEMDGLTMLETLKSEKLAPNAALIALTNQGADEEREKTESLGAHEYIVKANTVPSEVVNIIERTIEGMRHNGE